MSSGQSGADKRSKKKKQQSSSSSSSSSSTTTTSTTTRRRSSAEEEAEKPGVSTADHVMNAAQQLANESLRHRAHVVGVLNLTKVPTALSTGTANPVFHARMWGLRRQKSIFIKKHSAAARSEIAVASSRLARALGLRVIAKVHFYADEEMEGAAAQRAAGEGTFHYVQTPGGPKRRIYQAFNFRHPKIQQGLADLQLFDCITGQKDRHGGNIVIDPATGQVTGIDDDLAFEKGPKIDLFDTDYDSYVGFPLLVSASTRLKVLALDPDQLPGILRRGDDPQQLSDKSVDIAKARLKIVQDRLRKMPPDQIKKDKDWGDDTYNQLMSEPMHPKFGRKNQAARSYLKTLATELQSVLAGHGDQLFPGPVEIEYPAIQGAAVLSGMPTPTSSAPPPPSSSATASWHQGTAQGGAQRSTASSSALAQAHRSPLLRPAQPGSGNVGLGSIDDASDSLDLDEFGGFGDFEDSQDVDDDHGVPDSLLPSPRPAPRGDLASVSTSTTSGLSTRGDPRIVRRPGVRTPRIPLQSTTTSPLSALSPLSTSSPLGKSSTPSTSSPLSTSSTPSTSSPLSASSRPITSWTITSTSTLGKSSRPITSLTAGTSSTRGTSSTGGTSSTAPSMQLVSSRRAPPLPRSASPLGVAPPPPHSQQPGSPRGTADQLGALGRLVPSLPPLPNPPPGAPRPTGQASSSSARPADVTQRLLSPSPVSRVDRPPTDSEEDDTP